MPLVSLRAKCALIGAIAAAAVIAWLIIALADTKPDLRPVVLLTGDSLTEHGTDVAKSGWTALMQQKYSRTADVVSRGLPGYNTKWFLKDILPTIEREIRKGVYVTPSLITIWFGANDAALASGYDSDTHVPIEDYKENLKKIVSKFGVAAPTAHILLITPPHVNDSARGGLAKGQNGTIDRTNTMTKRYAQACVEAGASIDVPVLDLNSYFNAMSESTRNALLIADGLHFNSSGNELVYKQLEEKIAVVFPSLVHKLTLWQFPPASTYVASDPWTSADGER
ncbi:Isoamyl acetate-hydrolyzing esterase [Phytophthora megakarya]|uniref:Isoamyl acetate-hydrolyzing esterase n=1 Tax=Phytophthora megakarya TaxID=4795 RepID=A0A225V2I4_9STRA|nr:Isoamyl acetate-hydrolyzing esterase [Phytophthora megakarya]